MMLMKWSILWGVLVGILILMIVSQSASAAKLVAQYSVVPEDRIHDYFTIKKMSGVVERYVGPLEAWTVYRLCNPSLLNFGPKDVGISHYFSHGSEYVKNAKIQWKFEKTETYTEKVVVGSHYEYVVVVDNKTKEEITRKVLVYDYQDVERERTTYEWKDGLPEKIKAGKCYDVRIYGKLVPVEGFRSIEHVPVAFGYEFPEYDWWNSTMTRWPIISADNASGMFLLNDTYAVDSGTGPQYIWSELDFSETPYAYNDTNGNWYVANSTSQLPTFIDEGNGTGYGQPDANLIMWYPFSGCDGTDCKDKSRYGINVTNEVGDVEKAAGKVGKGTSYDGNDALKGADSPYMDMAHSFTISAWINSSNQATEGTIFIHRKTSAAIWKLTLSRYNADQPAFLVDDGSGDKYAESSLDVADGTWHMITGTYNDTHICIYVDASDITCILHGQTGNINPDSYWLIGAGSDAGGDGFTGIIDNLMIWNRTLSATEIESIYNNTHPDNYITLGAMETSPINNTSLYAFGMKPPDFSFSSSSYILGINKSFNTTEPNTSFVLLSSMNVKKITGGTKNDVYVKVKVDNNEILEEKLRSVERDDEGSTGTKPTRFSVANGQHFITFEFKRTGNGAVNINDIDISVLKMKTKAGNEVSSNITDINYEHSDTTFVPDFNFTVNKSLESKTVILSKMSLTKTSTGDDTTKYYFESLTNGFTSPYWARYLSSSSDTGSCSGIGLMPEEPGNPLYTIESYHDDTGNTVNVTGKLLTFDLNDENNITIINFNETNPNTNLSNDITVSGTSTIVSRTVTANSDSYVLMATISVQSTTGEQTPTFYLGNQYCSTKKERYLSGNNDVGNIMFFFDCDNITSGNNYTFYLNATVPSGETLKILDENLVGIESTKIDTADYNTPPIVAVIDPVDNSTSPGNLNIEWTVTDLQNDAYLVNLTAENSTGTYDIATELPMSVTSYSWDRKGYEGFFNITVLAYENETADVLTGNATVYNVSLNNLLLSPENTTYPSGDIPLLWQTTDDIICSSSEYSINGGSWTPTACANSTLSLDESYGTNVYLTMNMTDSDGNTYSETVYFTVYYGGMYDHICVYDEMNPDNLLSADSIILRVGCENTTINYTLTSSCYDNLNISCELVDMRMEAIFGEQSMWRTMIPETPTGNLTFYLTNASLYDVNVVNLFIQDVTGSTEGSYVRMTKILPDGETVMLSQYIDSEDKVIIHWVKDEKYHLYLVKSDGTTKDLRSIISDDSTSKTVTVSYLVIIPPNSLAGFGVEFGGDISNINLTYSDTRSKTTIVTFEVYNISDKSLPLLYIDTCTDINPTCFFNYTTPNDKTKYKVCYKALLKNNREYTGCHVYSGSQWSIEFLDAFPEYYAVIAVFIALFIIAGSTQINIKLGLVGSSIWMIFANYIDGSRALE